MYRSIIALIALLALNGCHPVVSKAPGPDPIAPQSTDEWAALSEPGASHRLLAPLEGNWTTEMKFWSQPGVGESSSQGKSSFKWIMGGRFLKEEVLGSVLEQTFQGLGLMGYDNAKRRFTTVWVDSFNTGIATAEGTYAADNQKFSFVGSTYDPLINGVKETKSEIDIVNADQFVFRMFDTAPDGREFKSLEITYHKLS